MKARTAAWILLTGILASSCTSTVLQPRCPEVPILAKPQLENVKVRVTPTGVFLTSPDWRKVGSNTARLQSALIEYETLIQLYNSEIGVE